MKRSAFLTALSLAAPTVLLLSACGEQRAPTEVRATTPSVAASRGEGGPEHIAAIVAHDSCEPNSFNEALNSDEACVKHGRTTFGQFIAELQASQVVRDWRFTPEEATARLGIDVLGNNVGGEEHTFTPVKQYGGGFVDILNQLSGNPVPAPECQNLDFAEDVVASGAKYLIEAEELAEVVDGSGIARVQCCIHPWMRSDIRMKR